MAAQDPALCDAKKMEILTKAINHLGIQLYKQLASEKTNMFFSPLSLSCALAMSFCGARDETSDEMRNALGYETANLLNEDVQSSFQVLLSFLGKDPESYTLSSANIVLSQHDFMVKDTFKDILVESFKAMVLEVDFRKESTKAIQQANDWVKEKTNDMIPQLLESLDPDTVLVILNAVYFKGVWTHQFEKKATFLQNFYNNGLDDNAKQVEMMHLKESFPFVEKDTFKALQLPYKGKEIGMFILLPNSRDGLEELEAKLSSDFIQDVKSSMHERGKVDVALPKFRLGYSKYLKKQFQGLGINRAFYPGAQFRGISDSTKLLISDIIHKAVLIVNEEGSEASALTALLMRYQCAFVGPELIVDHPFLFLIYNFNTDLILFMGKVEEL